MSFYKVKAMKAENGAKAEKVRPILLYISALMIVK